MWWIIIMMGIKILDCHTCMHKNNGSQLSCSEKRMDPSNYVHENNGLKQLWA